MQSLEPLPISSVVDIFAFFNRYIFAEKIATRCIVYTHTLRYIHNTSKDLSK